MRCILFSLLVVAVFFLYSVRDNFFFISVVCCSEGVLVIDCNVVLFWSLLFFFLHELLQCPVDDIVNVSFGLEVFHQILSHPFFSW